jgi:DNA-binding CsgD family transcriptional regulator
VTNPASAPLLLLVLPIALAGRRYGLRPALGAAVLATGAVLARSWVGDSQFGLFGDFTRTTAFVTVALLAGTRPSPSASAVSPTDSLHREGGHVQVPSDTLTKRELEVLGMIAAGLTNGQIADRLVLSESTIKSHVKNILRKLEVRNRTEAVSRYLRL